MLPIEWPTITGGSGRNFLFGDWGRDRLLGRGGIDELHGGADGDLLVGYGGNDVLFGDEGADQLLGDDEIASRLAALPPFVPQIRSRWLRRYARQVTSASTGAVLRD